MAAKTSIEWAANADGTPGATWNPIRAMHVGADGAVRIGTHCIHVSPGCVNCYAETFNMRGLPNAGTGLAYTKQNEAKVSIFIDERMLAVPLRRRKPTTFFLSSMTDVFADFVTDDELDRLFAVMALSPQHTFIVLTKRAERMRAWFAERWQGTPTQTIHVAGVPLTIPAGGTTGRRSQVEDACEEFIRRFDLDDTTREELWTPEGRLRIMQWAWPLPNVWLVVSVEDQRNADERIPHLLATPAAVRGVSIEPMLGPVDLTRMWLPMPGGGQSLTNVLRSGCEGTHRHNGDAAGHDHGEGTSRHVGDPRFLHHHHDEGCNAPRIDWVICGGESGPKARPMHPDWARSLRDQCADAGVPFFFKQWGEHGPLNIGSADYGIARMRDSDTMRRWGKARAGRLLDGVEHNARPPLSASSQGEAGYSHTPASSGRRA